MTQRIPRLLADATQDIVLPAGVFLNAGRVAIENLDNIQIQKAMRWTHG